MHYSDNSDYNTTQSEGKADTIIRGLDEAQNINCQSFKEGNKNYYKGLILNLFKFNI